MMKFFRKIRQRVVIEKKGRKYLIYAVGEIVLIVVGILLALQISEWNQDRKNRLEEKLILSRLSNELTINTNKISRLLKSMEVKVKALERVSLVLKGKPVENDSLFLSDVIKGGFWSWTVQSSQRIVFDELNNTGKLTIIRNTELRNNITQLYDYITVYEGTALAREGEYVKIVYGLVPKETESEMKANLSSSELREIVDRVINSNLDQTIIFEQNRAGYLKQMWTAFQERIALMQTSIELEV